MAQEESCISSDVVSAAPGAADGRHQSAVREGSRTVDSEGAHPHRSHGSGSQPPASTRNAIVLIIVANLTTVLIGGILVWLIDRNEFQELATAFWYALQTITTVGYGDVTPKDMSGRAVGATVMLLGIASLGILTATITSSFIRPARRIERHATTSMNGPIACASKRS